VLSFIVARLIDFVFGNNFYFYFIFYFFMEDPRG
jgi:hypothetical protein